MPFQKRCFSQYCLISKVFKHLYSNGIMKKIGVFILVLLFASLFVSAQSLNSTESRAEKCLEDKIGSKCSTLSFEQQVFSLLATGKCSSEIQNAGKSNTCWPSSSCKIKETSLAALALQNSGSNTDDAEKWLLSNSRVPTGIEFYLEVDIPTASLSQCKISFDSSSKKITIAEDRKISGDFSSCFSSAYDGYWLKIKDSCLNKKFEISCDKDFVSTILYKKSGSNIWHVSSDVQSASSSGTTSHQLNYSCLSTSNICDFEENLWAALALQKNNDINFLLPYLVTLSEEKTNSKFFPESYLYLFTSSENYLNSILAMQKTEGFWDVKSDKGKFFDTALGILSSASSDATNNAKSWLSSVQGQDGCWNNGNIRDTAFLLWAGWPNSNPTPNTIIPRCEEYNYHCLSLGECQNAEGNKLDNYDCSYISGAKICCDKAKVLEKCSDLSGTICTSEQTCSSSEVEASDTQNCCTGTCESTQSECEKQGNTCMNSCASGYEEDSAYSCSSSQICCRETSSGISIWVWILIILIILAILGIVFRDKLKLFIFKMRNKVEKQDVVKSSPQIPVSQYPQRRMIIPSSQPQIRKPQIPAKDKELEETLRKLKDMSK